MIQNLDLVVLTRSLADYGLEQGDVGTVVQRYTDGAAFEVEFVTAEGQTLAVLTLTLQDIRAVGKHEILHVRELVEA